MNTYEQLLEFAKKLQISGDSGHSYLLRKFAEEYKQQADRIAELEYELKSLAKRYKALDRTKPLSDDEIDKVASIKMNQILMDLIDSEDWNKGCTKQHLVNFARAIEERHGIK